MNKTKEEISIREQISNAIDNGRTAFKNWKSFNPSVEGMYSEDKFIIDKLESCLTDQIKSMENYISDVDGQVLKYSGKLLEAERELNLLESQLESLQEFHDNWKDIAVLHLKQNEQLESLQKENERLYDALSNIMNNERWLEMNIDTVNNLLSKHA